MFDDRAKKLVRSMTMITLFIWSLFTEANFDTEFGVGSYNQFRATCEWKPKKISFFFNLTCTRIWVDDQRCDWNNFCDRLIDLNYEINELSQ